MKYEEIEKGQIITVNGERYCVKDFNENEIIATKETFSNPIYRFEFKDAQLTIIQRRYNDTKTNKRFI